MEVKGKVVRVVRRKVPRRLSQDGWVMAPTSGEENLSQESRESEKSD